MTASVRRRARPPSEVRELPDHSARSISSVAGRGLRLSTDQFVLHDFEPHLLTATHLVQLFQPLTLLNQIKVTHRTSDVFHRALSPPIRDRRTGVPMRNVPTIRLPLLNRPRTISPARSPAITQPPTRHSPSAKADHRESNISTAATVDNLSKVLYLFSRRNEIKKVRERRTTRTQYRRAGTCRDRKLCCKCVVQVPAPPSRGLPDMVCEFGSSKKMQLFVR